MIYYACKALKLANLKNCVPDGDHLQMEDMGVQIGDFLVKVDFNTQGRRIYSKSLKYKRSIPKNTKLNAIQQCAARFGSTEISSGTSITQNK